MSNDYEFITTFPSKHEFAKNLTTSAEKYLLPDNKLVVYYEGSNIPKNTNKVEYINWDPTDVKQFITNATLIQNKKFPEHLKVNSKEYIKARGWMWHATRFCWKVYAMAEHAVNCSARYMIWIDSDVEFISPITQEWLESLHPEGYYSSFINRPNRYTETGFISFDTHHPYHNTFWKEMKASYDNLTIFDIKDGWTDCHVYDRTRKKAQRQDVKFYDIVYPEYKSEFDPAWKHTPLEIYTRHYKGERVDKA